MNVYSPTCPKPTSLSICIPTYNRCDSVVRLVSKMLEVDDSLEVCVHIDGSTDDTLSALSDLAAVAQRLRISHAENRGRAHALPAAIAMASSPYTMLFDDDDDIDADGIKSLLPRLELPLADDICGYICHMYDEKGRHFGSPFPTLRSNFLKLRFDDGVKGEKKEILKTAILKKTALIPPINIRRSPTSLILVNIALKYDVECVNLCLGRKIYHDDGYTKNITRLKIQNPSPMWEVNRLRVLGFLVGRYRSAAYAIRSAAAALFYLMCIPPRALQRML